MENKTASRAALLELRSERQVVEDGHHFLDEKRALLAHEALERLQNFSQQIEAAGQQKHEAVRALAEAVSADGFETLWMYAPTQSGHAELKQRLRSWLGLQLAHSPQWQWDTPSGEGEVTPEPPLSTEAQECARAFERIVAAAAPLATELGNLLRIMQEFERTQRRVRALEKVVLPELREDEKRMEDRLEEIEQEDAIRVRLAGRAHEG